ncbi:transcriptional regulator, MucR family [Rhodoblastus acidophilus]|uniref:Transcriptional regulator, MucR family n=1 Tax=Rhodoblastus acidophilus TaxID=1074 RepID=A0A212PZD7_RHOAC|nr:MucR family transcriptional regulator [Rhodoblastus acidophilus]PPQ38684.1 MucR family transcriptional regulator [Rhodoblastus acidophilus]RAI17819.1 MucR family transcriptional regulator [Rhodoblastus acidophilus]SNB52349.1 transcriptional regulator, MucR family [Rhodoblastus acidophilus]
MAENDNTALVAQILSSYLSNNTVAPADLTSVIETVKTAFGVAGGTAAAAAAEEPKKMEPAVSVKKSVNPDALTCLCCGKPFKSLKRHLQSEHNMSPDDYRATFGLKADYPIVAPNYSAQRSSLAKSAGLGRKAGETAKETKPVEKKPVEKKPVRRKAAVKAAAE